MSQPIDASATRVHGIEALRLGNGVLSVTVTTGMGPRVLSFAGPDGHNVLVEQPDAAIRVPGLPEYRMPGGHRLWHTPEIAAITYRPDDGPVAVTRLADGVDLVGTDDPVQGVRKRIRLAFDGDRLQLEHELVNIGPEPLTTSPWAITQVPPRGEAWLPLTVGAVDEGGYLPNRSLVLWPYSRLDDPRLGLSDDLVVVRGIAGSEGRVKIGTPRRRGWIAHRDAGRLFLVEAPEEPGTYGDMGAGTQCYSCGDFVEVETLGPLATLEPGASAVHRQTWRIVTVDPAASAADVIAGLGLAAG